MVADVFGAVWRRRRIRRQWRKELEHATGAEPTDTPVNGYTTEGWGELFLAEAGASAALGGLLFVAVSINLNRIIAIRSLPGAALGAIVLLVAVLMVSTFALVPGQPRWVLATEVLVVGIAAWSILTIIWIGALRAPIPNQPRFVPIISVVVTQAATLPMVVAGVSLLLGTGGGLYWLVPGVAFSLVVAVVNAWVCCWLRSSADLWRSIHDRVSPRVRASMPLSAAVSCQDLNLGPHPYQADSWDAF